jgi:uncharacterized protein (DUF2336 family)
MTVRKFLAWSQTASPLDVAAQARKLARAFLYGELAEKASEEARLALTALLDHSSPLVRRALAESLASAANAPHYMVLALANDTSGVASIVLSRSPVLSDAELVDCIATANAVGQSAIALRPWLPAPVAAALAEVGALEALIALAANPGAELMEFSVRRMIERYGHEAELRAALLARPNLSASSRSDLANAAAKALSDMVARRAGLSAQGAERLAIEARERAIVIIAGETASETREMLNFVAHLRRSGQLTAGLLLRGLLCGNKHLLELALYELTGVAIPRVIGLVSESNGAGFAALYRKAGMPQRLLPAFIAGLKAIAKCGCSGPMNARLQRPIIDSVLRTCASVNNGELDTLIAALRRLEAEAARDEVRDFRRAMAPLSCAGPVAAGARRLPPAARPSAPWVRSNAPETCSTKADCFSIDLKAFAQELAAT